MGDWCETAAAVGFADSSVRCALRFHSSCCVLDRVVLGSVLSLVDGEEGPGWFGRHSLYEVRAYGWP